MSRLRLPQRPARLAGLRKENCESRPRGALQWQPFPNGCKLMSWWRSKSGATHDQEKTDRSSESEMDETHPAAAELLELQHAVGNQSVQRILGGSSPGTAEASAEQNAGST